MNNRELRKEINRLAWPIIASMVLIRGVGIADVIILGHTGKEPLAAIGLGQQITFVGMALAYALSVGVNVMVSYYTGSKNPQKRTSIINSSIWLSVVVGLIMIMLGENFSRPLAAFMGAEGQVLDLVWKYLRLIWLFYTFRVFVYNLTAIFQGTGDSRTPMYVVSITNVVHIIVAYILVYGKFGLPSIGIEGAAWATVISDFLGASIMYIIALKRGLINFKMGWATPVQLRRLWDLSLPVIGERTFVSTAIMLFNAIVLHYSVAAYAATQIVINIEAFSFLPGLAYMQTAQILVGQNLGAKNHERAVRSGYQAGWIALSIMSVFGLTFLLFPSFWVSIFTNDPEVVPYGLYVCKMAAAMQPVLAITMVFGGALRGAGETRWVMYISFIGAWIVRLSFASFFAYILEWSVHPVWWAMFMDWASRAMLALWRYRKGGWKLSEEDDS
ncbi:MAG: MATE family efflux transporter [candidate division Zixibacteria bacterium]|nr:MATE family efflux transporter [candidate division Zixibacteria bacterium]NIS18032.1 MATE family efflux transporter [candidate division Zixibacteria bacterium]NIT54312.1 MATE family efflux transporter [candidate division Zixibacteria bacterium]NIU16888.1 MATE family efflux transporter [candidate division Zixibacteria bacterium]NIW41109.1 MATE family efflux transporter [candidate division Zixibacteria bacterium]